MSRTNRVLIALGSWMLRWVPMSPEDRAQLIEATENLRTRAAPTNSENDTPPSAGEGA